MSRRGGQSAPCVLLGPSARGRDYRILSGRADDLDPEERGLLEDFALVLASWAKRGGGAFVALFPLGSRRSALVRARYLREDDLGPLARATAALIEREQIARIGFAAHRLLGAVPEPDETQSPGVIALPADVGPVETPLPNPGLAWMDQAILTDADPESTLKRLIDGVEPPVQRARLTGWATAAGLPRIGAFDPAERLRLIVTDDRAAWRREVGRTRGEASGGRLAIEHAPPPTAWLAWRALAATAPGAGDQLWDPAWAEQPADAVVALATVGLCRNLAAPDRVSLLEAVARAADRADDPAVGHALAAGFARSLEVLMEAGEARGAATYLEPLVARIGTLPMAARETLVRSAAREPDALGVLGAAAIARLGEHGLARTLAERGWISSGWASTLDARRRGALLAGAAVDGEPARPVLIALIHASLASTPRLLPDAFELLLRWPPHPSESRLARVETIEALSAAAPRLKAAVARRLLRPVKTPWRHADDVRRWRAILAADAAWRRAA